MTGPEREGRGAQGQKVEAATGKRGADQRLPSRRGSCLSGDLLGFHRNRAGRAEAAPFPRQYPNSRTRCQGNPTSVMMQSGRKLYLTL